MALLDKGLKQRMVGAVVLLALAVILLPMLLSRQDEPRVVAVNAPEMPEAPQFDEVELEPVVVPEPVAVPEESIVPAESSVATAPSNAAPVIAPAAPVVAEQPVTATPAPAAKPPQSQLDANSLPISWSIQVASLSSAEGATKLQNTLRGQGYNAYVRTFDGMNRVFVGPVIDRAEAERMRVQLNRKHKVNGFLVRFQPEAR